ncbi:biotin--[acetyl-CoA-carboxylase] ligase [Sphingobium sp. CR2-8]|uniref:biotin--[acetyl-CoA-carboxylase] ligase n=1 Tax=Sphingobium sp. CR2-8 TaxID=1306534 RepID=UPI002DBA752D|nr:biotin--[acetyl-CoA-carboxylase] ligase [Sphingobium sp. CR2-8]MEC3911339.1 biotin--[acetyl-CoA-carboxylase] ligase [Sphingobium sp. CR2-8]
MLRYVEETGSTNADMLALAGQGAADGSWLRAGRQTGGRGRMGRTWDSPDGNLYCSTLVRLLPNDPLPHTLALVAANAVHALIAPLCDGQARIKWPNDILVDGAKIAGILLERAGDAIIVGIGINVSYHPMGLDRPVTSLAEQGAAYAQAAILYDRLAQIFGHWLSIWRAQGLDPVRTHWLLNAHPTGTTMRVMLPDGGMVEGMFDTLDRQGMLILRLANGQSHAIHAGDIILS